MRFLILSKPNTHVRQKWNPIWQLTESKSNILCPKTIIYDEEEVKKYRKHVNWTCSRPDEREKKWTCVIIIRPTENVSR